MRRQGRRRSSTTRCAPAAPPSIKKAIRQLALSMQGRGGSSSDPRRDMAKAIAEAAKATLSAEQVARFQKELDARDAARKRLAILNLVAMTDRALLLRP